MSKSTFSDEYKLLLSRVKRARLDSGMTQKEAAIKFGRNQSFISKIESGERRIDVIELAQLMRIYRASADMMLSDIVPNFKKPKKKKN